MILTVLALPLVLTGQVDRIEANQAVVDWRGATTSEIPTSLFGNALVEGDTVVLRVAKRPLDGPGNATPALAYALSETGTVLATTAGPIEISTRNSLQIGHTYHLSLFTQANPSHRIPPSRPLRLPLAGTGASP